MGYYSIVVWVERKAPEWYNDTMTMAMRETQCLFKEKNYSTASRLQNSRVFFSK